MRKRLGTILMAIAVLHEVVGLFVYSTPLQDIFQAGFFNTINPPYWERDAAFWFLMFGVTLFLMGWIAQWMLNNIGIIPKFFSFGLLIMCIIGVMMMPASGFWLAIPVALMMLQAPSKEVKQIALT
ncbi:MAG: DUF6463 family protein [Phototrophicaceae bacterium]